MTIKKSNALDVYLNIKSVKKDLDKNNLLITVGIFTYNRAEYLSEAIKSVLNQTYNNFEIVISDDGSTDNTEDVVRSFDSNKIKYIKKDHTNAADTRNYTLRAAKGDYILWMGDDDLLLPETLSVYNEQLKHYPDVDIFYPKLLAFENITGETEEISYNEWYNKKEEMLRFSILMGQPIPDGGSLIKKSVYDEIGEFNINCKRGFDFEFFSRVIQKQKFNAKYINQVLYKYRRHSSNITYKKLKPEDLQTERNILDRFIKKNDPQFIFSDLDWLNEKAKSELIANCRIGIKYFQYLGKDEGSRYLSKAIQSFPNLDGLITAVELLLGANLGVIAQLLTNQFTSNIILNNEELKIIEILKTEILKSIQANQS